MNRRQRIGLRIAGLIACAILGMFAFHKFELSQVYIPSRELRARPSLLGRPFEDVMIPVEGGQSVNAWYFPVETGAGGSRHPVFLHCHGNAGNIGDRLEMARSLLEAGGSVLVFDYRGYGRSDGKPGEENTYRDGQAAYRWLRSKGFAPAQIILYGESLGGGIASELALREPAGGLVLHSSFTSIPDIGAELFPWLPVRLLASIHYDTLSKLPRIKIPVLIFHSRKDEIIPFHHSERNFAAANEPKFFCEVFGGHNDTFGEMSPGAETALKKFVGLVASNQPPASPRLN